jgi:tetratricopeptide (TPR) repeat protein
MGQDGRDDRIDGWKSIAGHLGRDRSTAIRWARERGLPIHALPGGKSRSVYALTRELDAWMRGQGDIPADPVPADPPPATIPHHDGADPIVVPPPPAPAPPSPRRRWRGPAIAAGGVVLAAGALALGWPNGTDPTTLDAATQARFIAARDDVALRSAPRLRSAITTLTAIARVHPAQAEVQIALAEAWLLAREYGSAPDAVAFDKASRAIEAARRIDPASATADRIEGAVAYWWDRDPARAGAMFRRSIARDPQDALTRLWYGNILADVGEDVAAMREFDAARMLRPGASYILADYGWGLWSAGRTAEATTLLTGLSRREPTLSSIPDCLSVMALAEGDLAGYVHHLRERARLRDEPELVAYGAALGRMLAADTSPDHAATYAVMLSRALSLTQNAEHPDHSWAAFIASTAGDRAQLVPILRDAQARGERWGSAGFVRRIRARWTGDAEIIRTLDMMRHARIEA